MVLLAPALHSGLRGIDWFGVGLLLALVGGLLLANAVLFLGPKGGVPERLSGRPALRSLRDRVFLRVQLHLGFLFLVAGLALQLGAHYASAGAGTELPFVVGGVILAGIGLEIAAWWLSHGLFKRTLREHFLQHPPDFETDTALAREVGALFDMKSRADETVTSYAERLRRELGLPAPGRRDRGLPPADVEED